jgi:hypothetical protein
MVFLSPIAAAVNAPTKTLNAAVSYRYAIIFVDAK